MINPHIIGLFLFIIVLILFFASIKFRKLLTLALFLSLVLVIYECFIFSSEYSLYKKEYDNIVGVYQLSINSKWTTIDVFDKGIQSNLNIKDYEGLRITLTDDNKCRFSQKTPIFGDTIGQWRYGFFNDRPLLNFNGNESSQFAVGQNYFSISSSIVIDSAENYYQLYFIRIK